MRKEIEEIIEQIRIEGFNKAYREGYDKGYKKCRKDYKIKNQANPG